MTRKEKIYEAVDDYVLPDRRLVAALDKLIDDEVRAELRMTKDTLPPLVDAIEFRMEQYGHSQAEAARKMGIAPTHFNEMLKGKRAFTVKVLKKLYIYGIPAPVLLQSHDEIKESK